MDVLTGFYADGFRSQLSCYCLWEATSDQPSWRCHSGHVTQVICIIIYLYLSQSLRDLLIFSVSPPPSSPTSQMWNFVLITRVSLVQDSAWHMADNKCLWSSAGGLAAWFLIQQPEGIKGAEVWVMWACYFGGSSSTSSVGGSCLHPEWASVHPPHTRHG